MFTLNSCAKGTPLDINSVVFLAHGQDKYGMHSHVSRISKSYHVVTEVRRKVGWIPRFSKSGSGNLIVNLKKKAEKLCSLSTTVQPILTLGD